MSTTPPPQPRQRFALPSGMTLQPKKARPRPKIPMTGIDAPQAIKDLANQAEQAGDHRAACVFWRALEQLGHRRPDHVPNYEPQPAEAPEQTGEQTGDKKPESPAPKTAAPAKAAKAAKPEPAKEPAREPEQTPTDPQPEQEIPAAFNKLLELARGDTRKAVRAIIQDDDLPDAVKTAKIRALLNTQPQ